MLPFLFVDTCISLWIYLISIAIVAIAGLSEQSGPITVNTVKTVTPAIMFPGNEISVIDTSPMHLSDANESTPAKT